MNLLAHALLAAISLPPAGGQSTTGALMADYFSGENLSDYPAALAQAISQHIAIDQFTDTHPLFITTRQRIAAAGAPRFSSGILTDIFWGHILAADWEELARPLCGSGLEDFCAEVYSGIEQTRQWHSRRFVRAAKWITGYRWLERYATRDGIVTTLEGLGSRLSGASKLPESIEILDRQQDSLRMEFREFWPQAVRFAQEWMG
ncbi:MAG: DUF479 domain-containing protein [Spirochaetes bacterium]|nr:DUF479 domain-containing protein [Spirochaetota bacterium]